MSCRLCIARLFSPFPVLLALSGTLFAQPARKHNLLVLPVISKSIETGWSFGGVGAYTFHISADDTLSRTSNLEAIALYSTKKQLVTAINGTQYFKKEKYILSEQLSYSSFPDKFWGLGKNTADEAVEPYKFQQYYIYAHLMRKIDDHLFTGLVFEHQRVWDIQYDLGGVFDKEDVKGRSGYKVSGLGASITFDTRNHAFSPDRGFYVQLFANHFDRFWGSDFNYNNIILDLRRYISLGRQQVLAFQLYSFNNTGSEVPIRSLAAFGGASRMRGFYEGRYRDYDQLLFQGEYRRHISGRFGLALFAGTGSVAREWPDYALNDLRYSVGGGVRIALDKKERLNLRLDYGNGGGKNNGFYLQLGEAF